MMPTKGHDIYELLESHIVAAALSAALELQLFWRLAEQPQTVSSIADMLNIPPGRCRHWLELLTSLSLLDKQGDAYTLSPTARAAIVDVYSSETWRFLAQEAREGYLAGNDLALHISYPGSVWAAQGRTQTNYVAQMAGNPERARRFTCMLYELHQALANELAETLDMSGVRRLMDLGGGSGVVSLALVQRHHPDLTAVVVDIANVCAAGREIAADNPLAEHITYHAADFLHDELPGGFDMVLECDVGIYDEVLFRKLWTALNVDGRLVIVDNLARPGHVPSLGRTRDVFYRSLSDPDYTLPSVSQVQSLLAQAGFQPASEQVLPGGRVVIQARKQRKWKSL